MLKFIQQGKRQIKATDCISKHLMLKFIRIPYDLRFFRYFISKHLMLKFIQNRIQIIRQYYYFKTSYVEVYHPTHKCTF